VKDHLNSYFRFCDIKTFIIRNNINIKINLEPGYLEIGFVPSNEFRKKKRVEVLNLEHKLLLIF
jgi:hypothetical protein